MSKLYFKNLWRSTLVVVLFAVLGIKGYAQPTGAIRSLFSIGEGQYVCFSKGNLQYRASDHTWRFAENQWDYVGGRYSGTQWGTVSGSSNSEISETYSGWIDLFGWGTSGFNHNEACYQPWSTSTTESDYYAYGIDTCNLYDNTGQADWGFNRISNGGDVNEAWHTLAGDEWNYILNSRATSSGIRYAMATVNGVKGLILFPDSWKWDGIPYCQ